MKLTWLTRGKNWSFCFLRNGGLDDPLPTFEAAFSDVSRDSEAFQIGEHGIADPEGRHDSSGRVIPHNYVIRDATDEQIHSLEDAIPQVWPLVVEEYAAQWDATL